MNKPRPLADPRLEQLLSDLLAEESLPPLDRWFSSRAKARGWTVADQKRLWDSLRRALARGYSLLPAAATPEVTGWGGFRVALRGRAAEWAIRADLAAASAPTVPMAGIPGWLEGALNDRIKRSAWTEAQRKAFLAAQETPAPVHVRFRTGPEGESARRRLVAVGLVVPSEVEGLDRLGGVRGLEATEEWKKGLIEIQDASSQLSLKRLNLRPGMRVWDVCAGQGGKTLAAAAELRGKGALVATDVAENKLKTLKERVRRSAWQNIRLVSWDGKKAPDFGPEVNARGGFDRVIVDAPCTATGTWRRDPEGRFRLTPRTLKELGTHQERLLRLGWGALRTGGQLAYVTCSWLPAENEEVIRAFVEETGAHLVHEEMLGLPQFDANTLYVAILEKS